MDNIKILDKQFSPFIHSDDIQRQVKRMAASISKDFQGQNPLFVVVLNGAFMFASDLLKNITFACEVSFIKLSSYAGTRSSGQVKELIGLESSVHGRTVFIVEDIIDTGITMEHTMKRFQELGASKVVVVALLFKPDAFTCNYRIDYTGMEIPNDFIVGYGLDYSGYGRNYPDIYKVSHA
ncbi:MAG: hypoxanthine phosphoribosyltransferase [Bacteroidales bacterium]|nr:hypoxanthine phosphoribosyltransferase [Bacteroidales bacterium]